VVDTRAQSQPFVPGSDKSDRVDQFKETLKQTGPVGGPDQVTSCGMPPLSAAVSCVVREGLASGTLCFLSRGVLSTWMHCTYSAFRAVVRIRCCQYASPQRVYALQGCLLTLVMSVRAADLNALSWSGA
jgi:hypothetical protein